MQLVPVMDTRNNENIAFFSIDYSQKSNFCVIILDMCCNSCRKKQIFSQIFSHLLDIISLFVSKFTAQHSTAQHSTAQHSTAQHSTSYNSARNIISGYMHFKSNITTFSHRETAHDAGKIMSCTWAFISVLQCLENRNKGESRVKVKRPSYDICQYHDS